MKWTTKLCTCTRDDKGEKLEEKVQFHLSVGTHCEFIRQDGGGRAQWETGWILGEEKRGLSSAMTEIEGHHWRFVLLPSATSGAGATTMI